MEEEKIFFEKLPEKFNREAARSIANELNISESKCNYFIKIWKNTNLIKTTKKGVYEKTSLEFKENGKIIVSYLKFTLNKIFPSLTFKDIELIETEEDIVVFQTKLIMPLMNVLIPSKDFINLVPAILSDCEPKISITPDGIVLYENLEIACEWSEEEFKLAQKRRKKP